MTRSPVRIGLALVALLALSPEADARAGAGGSVGSRGARTYSAPAPTSTAPAPAAPITRSDSQPAQPSPNQGLARPAPANRGGFFSGGFGRGLLGGLVGAGIFGLLMGNGLFGGLGDIMSILGLVLQIGLVVLAVRFAIGFFRRKTAVAGMAGMPGAMQPQGAASAPAPAASPALAIGPNDFNMFEQRLGEVETAYGNEDINTLRQVTTPEMANYFAQELEGNQRKGVINRLGNVRLLQGDLSESWREAGTEFATLAMRFALIDATYDRNSQRLVAGNDNVPQEATEVWTFQRPANGNAQQWKLSAIQQG